MNVLKKHSFAQKIYQRQFLNDKNVIRIYKHLYKIFSGSM
jgi:hypothetical protein